MVTKREEEINRKKKPKVLKVPMNLSDKEMGQLKNNLLLELKRKSLGRDDGISLPEGDLPRPPPPPIPRVKFPKKAPSEKNPADLRAQMMKELNRRVSCVPDDEEAFHCYKPSTLVPDLSKTNLQVKPERVVYVPRGVEGKTLDADSIRDLLSWHEAERKRLKADLEKLPQAEQAGEQQVRNLTIITNYCFYGRFMCFFFYVNLLFSIRSSCFNVLQSSGFFWAYSYVETDMLMIWFKVN